jgi:hypothetical protein
MAGFYFIFCKIVWKLRVNCDDDMRKLLFFVFILRKANFLSSKAVFRIAPALIVHTQPTITFVTQFLLYITHSLTHSLMELNPS